MFLALATGNVMIAFAHITNSVSAQSEHQSLACTALHTD